VYGGAKKKKHRITPSNSVPLTLAPTTLWCHVAWRRPDSESCCVNLDLHNFGSILDGIEPRGHILNSFTNRPDEKLVSPRSQICKKKHFSSLLSLSLLL
jgi:hypothetical protein